MSVPRIAVGYPMTTAEKGSGMLMDRCIHIVDAHGGDREHGAVLLRAAGYDVLTHPSGQHFLDSQPDRRLGCILLDIHMPEPDGLRIQDQLIASGVAMPMIVFTGDNDIEIAVRAIRAGALHFLQKPYADAELLSMVADAFDRLDANEADADRKAAANARLALLSPREIQVVQGMLAGLPNKLIAHGLGLSIRTVEMYRIHLMEKLGARGLSTVFRLWFDAERETPEPSDFADPGGHV
ncbi:MAG: response regulator transcription factor [Acetobacteraceae bacterium]|nr:MAG: response regulator transcription factor [Acetobacteraceae bacterium]